ncbi:MAG: hypothetical protein ACRDMX_13800 [Solirubrobacteraceae bacterium]
MRHAADGVLRRLDDEPLAVPDKVTAHVASCERCRARRALIAADAAGASRLLSGPRPAPDPDLVWTRLQAELHRGPQGRTRQPLRRATGFGRGPRLPQLSLRAGLAAGAVGVVVAGTAAAATLTTIFAPTHVAPVSLNRGELQAIATLSGLGDDHAFGTFSTPSGSTTLPFGTLSWSSSGTAHVVASLAAASADAGFTAALPARLPAGVGAVRRIGVQPRVSAAVSFGSRAAGLAGSSVAIDAGPAVLVEYGGTNSTELPALGVVTMRRPTASSSGATLSQIEAFLLAEPGIPPQLAEEVRLLGNLGTTLPVPVPPGASARSVQINGRPGVLLADATKVAAAVIWENGGGMLHVVAGLLDPQDVLNVARQLH